MASKVYLSHKKFRALIKKAKRKLKRQAAAKERDALLSHAPSPDHEEHEAHRERERALQFEIQEQERLRRHQEWLQREHEAQRLFEQKQLQEREAQRHRDEEARRMQQELEEKNRELEEARRKEEKTRQDKENKLKEIVDQLPEGDGPWHNPIAPQDYREREVCGFFTKTGACRFGDRCSRLHPRPLTSNTLLIRGLYSHFSLEHSMDQGLEYDDLEARQHFLEFYRDVLPEFSAVGKLLQFKVCCNSEPHLRGNVYVQYPSEEEAQTAFVLFNGRFYAGRQISCQFVTVEKWKAAICGQFYRNRCPKGKGCNFLHVFRNPQNEFWQADQDLPVEESRRRRSRSRDDGRRSRRKTSRSRSRERRGSVRNGSANHRKSRSRTPNRTHRRRRSRSNSRKRNHRNGSTNRSRSRDRRTSSPEHRSSKKRKHSKRKRHSSSSPDDKKHK